MMPVCSASSSCFTYSQISLHGGFRPFCPFQKDFNTRTVVESVFSGLSNGTHTQRISLNAQVSRTFSSNFVESNEQSAFLAFINDPSCSTQLDDTTHKFYNDLSSSAGIINEGEHLTNEKLKYVESYSISSVEERLVDLTDQTTESADSLLGPVEPDTISAMDITPENPSIGSDSLDVNNDSLSSVKTSFDDFLSGITESITNSINKGEYAVKNSLDTIASSITSLTQSASEAVDSALGRVFSTVDRTGESAGNRLTSLSSDLKEATSKAAVVSVDVLRGAIVAVEDFITKGASFVVYSYGSTKELLPSEIRDSLNQSEDRALQILGPVGIAFQQVYIAIEGLEKSLGLDPNDPVVPFILFLGTTASLWAFYLVWTYGGYSGDLSPQSTLDLLSGKGNAILIDVRPEALRKKDGIPDLRRAARFRYATVTLPEVDGAVRKLLKGGRDLDDILIAAVIQNLKAVQDRSTVIVMDADGTSSKGIARSLRKLGVKGAYLVQGGFQYWVKQGLRFKELRPETTLTILNEEAEAILEDISPSPVQVVGYGVGLVVALYALLEWEKTLQFVGVFGLAQTIYRRLASYKSPEDFIKDVRLLIAPVSVGAQAFSWAAGKLENNRIGLPTSPSSSDVQNRVLQAAAKHESQPSDTEGTQNPPPESVATINEKVDLSEA